MNKQQITDLIFIIVSIIPALFLTIALAVILAPTSFLSNTINYLGSQSYIVVSFFAVTFFGIYNVIFFLTRKNRPVQYEKGKRYGYYILIAGLYNLMLTLIYIFVFLSAIGIHD